MVSSVPRNADSRSSSCLWTVCVLLPDGRTVADGSACRRHESQRLARACNTVASSNLFAEPAITIGPPRQTSGAFQRMLHITLGTHPAIAALIAQYGGAFQRAVEKVEDEVNELVETNKSTPTIPQKMEVSL